MASRLQKTRSSFDIRDIIDDDCDYVSGKPSLLGFLAAKRTARKLKRKMILISERREEYKGNSLLCHSVEPVRSARSSRSMVASRKIASAPTNSISRNSGTFSTDTVRTIIRRTLEEELDNKSYQPDYCRDICHQLADRVKDRVKSLHLPRYKIICYVNVGQNVGQGTNIASQCLWDHTFDSYASYHYRNPTLFAVCVVYAVYFE